MLWLFLKWKPSHLTALDAGCMHSPSTTIGCSLLATLSLGIRQCIRSVFLCWKFQSERGHNIFDPNECFFQEFRVDPSGNGADGSLYVVNLGRNEFSARIHVVVKEFNIDDKGYGRKGWILLYSSVDISHLPTGAWEDDSSLSVGDKVGYQLHHVLRHIFGLWPVQQGGRVHVVKSAFDIKEHSAGFKAGSLYLLYPMS